MFEYLNSFLAYVILLLLPVGLISVFLRIRFRQTRERILRNSLDRQISAQQKYLDNLALKHKRELERRERSSKGFVETVEVIKEKTHTLDDINRIARSYNYVVYASSSQINSEHVDDLLAVPWTNTACEPEKLIEALCAKVGLKILGEMEEHEQRRFTVHLKSLTHEYFHLSIMKPCSCQE